MKATDTMKVKGSLNITVTGPDGAVKENVDVNNLVVTDGREYIIARMKDSGSPNEMSHMAIGSDSTSPAAGDTALGTEEGRVSLTTAGGTVVADEVTYVGAFPAGTGTGAIVEAGIFNAGSGGTMLCRTTFPVINKGADDTMTITWVVTVASV